MAPPGVHVIRPLGTGTPGRLSKPRAARQMREFPILRGTS